MISTPRVQTCFLVYKYSQLCYLDICDLTIIGEAQSYKVTDDAMRYEKAGLHSGCTA